MSTPLTERSKKLWRFLGAPVIGYSAAGAVAGLVLSCVEFTLAYLIQALLISVGAMQAPPPNSILSILLKLSLIQIIALLIVSGAARGVFQGLREYMVGGAIARFVALQRTRLLSWIFDRTSVNTAEAVSLFTEQTVQASQAVGALQRLSVQASTAFVLGLGLLHLFPWLTSIALAVLATASLLMRKVDAELTLSGQGLAGDWSRINKQLVTSIRNLFLIHIYNTRGQEEGAANHAVHGYLNHTLNYYRLIAVKTAIPQILGLCMLCGIAYFGSQHGMASNGKLLPYFYLFMRFVQAVSEVANGAAQFQVMRPHLESLAHWWAEHSHDGVRGIRPVYSSTKAPQLPQVGWVAQNLTFSFAGAKKPVLKNLSFIAKPREALVIVGPSGTGKTTLLQILVGLLRPQTGTLDLLTESSTSANISKNQASLLASVGYVGPDSYLFDGTILENLQYGLYEAPTELEIEDALKNAECGFVEQFPNRLNHRITDQGEGISAGQKQRLALARALLRKPKVLILDEATANLDSETEMRLIKTFQQLKSRITLVAVTHRDALLSIADQVVRLSE